MATTEAATSFGRKYEGRDLVIVRVFDAPRELVWKAWDRA